MVMLSQNKLPPLGQGPIYNDFLSTGELHPFLKYILYYAQYVKQWSSSGRKSTIKRGRSENHDASS